MEPGCQVSDIPSSSNGSRGLANLSPNKLLLKSAIVRSMNANSIDTPMTNQSTPVAGKKFQMDGMGFDFSCMQNSVESLETEIVHRLDELTQEEPATETEDATAIKNRMLEAEVEKLKWQLHLVENNRKMYHKVMVEVIRFLDKCSHDLNVTQDSQNASTSTPKDVLNKNSSKSNDTTESVSESYYKKCSEFYNQRSKKCPEPPASARLAKEASRLLRTAQNLVNTKEPNLQSTKPSANPTTPKRKCENVPKSPRTPSNQSKSLSQSPVKEKLRQSNSDLFWDKVDGGSTRFSLPLTNSTNNKQTVVISSTEDEGIGGSVGSVNQLDRKGKGFGLTAMCQKLFSARKKSTTSTDSISKK